MGIARSLCNTKSKLVINNEWHTTKRGVIMIYLMRHGADPSDRYGGWSAYGLTEKGKAQVHSAKDSLRNKGITQIYSSDLARAKETAEIVANELSLKLYIYLNSANPTMDYWLVC